MKLSDILENTSIQVVGNNRPTPAANLQHHGITNAPLPHELCKDREWCERKKKKKDKKVKDLENRYKRVVEMTLNYGSLPINVVTAYVDHLKQHGERWADATGGRTIDKVNYQGMDIYGLRDYEGNLVSFVTFTPATYNNQEFYQLHTLATVGNKKGGFYPQMTLLWNIKQHVGKPIIDYGAHTPEGKRFAAALGKTKRFKLFWFNVETGEKEEFNPSDDPEESKYRSSFQKTPWRLIMERSEYPAFPRDAIHNGFPFGIPYDL